MKAALKTIAFVCVASALLPVGIANSADYAVPRYKAPPLIEAPVDRSGWYVGGFMGVAVARSSTSNDPPYLGFNAGGIPLSYDLDPAGIMGGGMIGYNWYRGPVLLGLELEGGTLGIRHTERPAPDDMVAVDMNWYMTATGRIGWAWDQVTPYIKGGLALANVRNTASDLTLATDYSDVSGMRVGWALGAGFEYPIADRWSLRSEYMYMDFGTRGSTNADGDSFSHKNAVHTWKMGLNYRFWAM